MTVFIGKTHHFIFDRWTVTRADPFDDPGIHRAAIKVSADHIMGALIGVRDVTRNLAWMVLTLAHEGKNWGRIITVLRFQYREINAIGIDTWWCAGF
ncbi:Uncharacterised protein [Vibrio cholerae]|uniref:Uncharacterized protein n=2 Tax=Vibrio cholerae TaxID=666 RepID=A0A656A1W4_VIBCL|nr:Uncharacterised protein [Vibrio cholerae]CSC92540.1 Uncharacterised protein [Vibrio cholerae]